ncbi:hypothetical protein MMC07_002742 [Pseudocyphellaria aurata]|nr:hypothetical protein [Pseudocyphellaria aurata]
MEHLSLPNDPVFVEADVVDLVCWEDYDGGPFLTYPLRKGRAYMIPAPGHVSYLDHERLYPTPVSELESFLQNWLFFGLLHEILGELYDRKDFVRRDESSTTPTTVVSTAKLLALIDTWIRGIAMADSNHRISYDHIGECLWLVRTTLQAVPADFNSSQKYSIASVAELIGFAANKAFDVQPLDSKCPTAWTLNFSNMQKESQMLSCGWCPAEIARSVHLFKSLQTLHFLSRMRNFKSQQRHRWCSTERCEAYQSNLVRYQTVHRTVDCPCDDYISDLPALTRILAKGALPLLRISKSESLDDFSVELVESQKDSSYIALSHTWADGLGNPSANALPRCQLLHISNLASAIANSAEPASTMFNEQAVIWIDTLCCPAVPGEARQMALAQMKRTYQEADHVLVLDSSLRAYNRHSLSAVEACVRIFTSGWMRRLWTLQEGSLAKRIWFQFQDSAIELHSLWLALCRILTTEVGRKGLAFDMLIETRGLRTFSHRHPGDPPLGPGVSVLVNALQHRSVSVASDEPLLIGNLLNLDTGRILQSPIEFRMQVLWSQMCSVPRGIPQNILFHIGPKLAGKGYRWAPATLLIPKHSLAAAILPLAEEKYTGVPSPGGLLVHLPGFFVSSPKSPPGLPDNPWNLFGALDDTVLYMRDCNKTWYQATHASSRVAAKDEEKKIRLCKIVRGSDHHAILLASEFDARSDLSDQTRNALLVKMQHSQDGINHVQSKMQLIVGRVPELLCRMLESTYQCAENLHEDELSRTVAEMKNNQVSVEHSSYTNTLHSLRQRIRDLAAAIDDVTVRNTAKEYTGSSDDIFFESLIATLYMGRYGLMGLKISGDQQWCVD